MGISHDAKLTSAELSQIWAAYVNDSMAICVLQHFSETVEDPDIAAVIQQGLQFSQSHIQQLTTFFNGENWPLPQGFTDADIHPGTPRLFSDHFMLYYMHQMGMLGLNAYSMALALAARPDLHDYFDQCLKESSQLHKQANDVLLEKGLYIRSPYIPAPEGIDFVTDKKFLGGWFGDTRPLLSLEIANLYANIQRNDLGKALMVAFSQVANSQEVQQFMVRGKEIASKHIRVFSASLNKDDLPATVTWDTEVMKSTISPFSDKLMMFHTTALIGLSVGYYGMSLSTSLRMDLSADYTRLTAEILKYSADGAKIMIDNGWLEEPPQAPNRTQLKKRKA